MIDSAPGFASEHPSGQRLGARGDCEVFSFHATKTAAIGEGGAVTARDHRLVEELEQLKNFGYDGTHVVHGTGLNVKLPELASAMGLRQLATLEQRLVRRRAVIDWYHDLFEPLDVRFQVNDRISAPAFVSVELPSSEERSKVTAALDVEQIGWRADDTPPVHRHPAFVDARVASELTVTEQLAGTVLSLPLDEELSRDDVERIAHVVRGAVG